MSTMHQGERPLGNHVLNNNILVQNLIFSGSVPRILESVLIISAEEPVVCSLPPGNQGEAHNGYDEENQEENNPISRNQSYFP